MKTNSSEELKNENGTLKVENLFQIIPTAAATACVSGKRVSGGRGRGQGKPTLLACALSHWRSEAHAHAQAHTGRGNHR